MAGEVQSTRTFLSNWYINGRIEFSNGKYMDSFQSKDSSIGLVLMSLSNCSTEESPNMTMDEFYRTLHAELDAGYSNKDYEVTAENLHQFVRRVEPYQTEDSEGGTDVTVDEMMDIAVQLKKDYDAKENKPWYKFW